MGCCNTPLTYLQRYQVPHLCIYLWDQLPDDDDRDHAEKAQDMAKLRLHQRRGEQGPHQDPWRLTPEEQDAAREHAGIGSVDPPSNIYPSPPKQCHLPLEQNHEPEDPSDPAEPEGNEGERFGPTFPTQGPWEPTTRPSPPRSRQELDDLVNRTKPWPLFQGETLHQKRKGSDCLHPISAEKWKWRRPRTRWRP